MDIVEIIAVIFSLCSVILASRKNIHTWTTGAIGVLAYSIIFYDAKLYNGMILQSLFMVLSVIGYFSWKGISKPLKINTEESVIVIGCIGIFFMFLAYAYYSNNSMPFADSLVSTLSIYATILLIKEDPRSWKIWILVNVCYIIIFCKSGLYLSSLIYLLFLSLSIDGYLKWNTKISKDV